MSAILTRESSRDKDSMLLTLRETSNVFVVLVICWGLGPPLAPGMRFDSADAISRQKVLLHFFSYGCRVLLFFMICSMINQASACLIRLRKGAVRKKHGPPFEGFKWFVPAPHWCFGHLHLLGAKGFFLNTRKLFVDYCSPSGISTFWIESRPTVAFVRKDDVNKVFRYNYDRVAIPYLARHWVALLGEGSLMFTHGKKWMANRAIVHRAFTRAALRDLQHDMFRIAHRGVQSVLATINKESIKLVQTSGACEKSNCVPMEMLSLYQMLLLDIFGVTTMGHDFECTAFSSIRRHWILDTFAFLLEEVGRRCFAERFNPAAQLYWIPTKRNFRHRRENKRLHELLRSVVRDRLEKETQNAAGCENERKNPSKKTDLIGHLLRGYKSMKTGETAESSEGKNFLTETFLGDFLVSLLYGGFDTTAVALSYASYFLAKNPQHEMRCYEEVITVLGPPSSLPSSLTSFDAIEQLPYCHAVLLEAMRIYPPVPCTVRTLSKPMTVKPGLHRDGECASQDEYTFPAGTRVSLSAWWIHRQPDNFPRPLEFLPERWVQRRLSEDPQHAEDEARPKNSESAWEERNYNAKENVDDETLPIPAGDRKALFTFSTGGRVCVGQRYAIQDAVIVLALFVREIRMQLPPDYEMEPVRKGMIQHPSQGLPMILTAR